MAIAKENERKKEYLKGYIYSMRKAQRLKEQIEELRSQQMFQSANHDGMPQGNAHSDLSGYMAKLNELRRKPYLQNPWCSIIPFSNDRT